MYDRSTIYPAILERMRGGESLRAICLDEAMPHIDTVMDWLNDDKSFSVQYTRAGEIRGDYWVDRAATVIAVRPPLVVDSNHKAGDGSPRMDSAHVAWQRAEAEICLKIAALVAPKKYGAKLAQEISGPEGGPIEITRIERVIVNADH